MELTDHQATIYRQLESFIDIPINQDEDTYLALLEGPAGTGKTWIMNKLVHYIRKVKHLRVVGVAMTHKARKVLHRSINQRSIIQIPTMTIASLLNKTRSHSYIGTNNYKSDGGNKIEQFDVFVIDEVSMISDNDYIEITNYALKRTKKILFIGDAHQIPHPTQRLELKEEYCQKAISMAFQLYLQYHLTEIVRQQEGNTLIDYYMKIYNNLEGDSSFKPTKENGIEITDDKATFEMWIEKKYQRFRKHRVPSLSETSVNISNYRIIVYTNVSVSYYNKIVRRVLGYPAEKMIVGDFLMGYTNLGFPERIIENGQDYFVRKIEPTTNYVIKALTTFSNLVGYVVSIQEMDESAAKINEVFMPDIDDEHNYDVIMELYRLARLVNQKNSTKEDFRTYAILRNQMVFCENVFYFAGHIDKESSFKKTHPLLFTNTLETMTDDRNLYTSNKCQDIDANYPKLREFRKEDDKALSETERLADIFQILEKDVDYGYSITCHKCVSGDTLISTGSGLRYIKSLVDQNGWTSIDINLHALDGQNKADKIYKGNIEKSINIVTRLGYSLEGSYRHPVLVMDKKGNEIWKKLPDIEIGDTIIMRYDLSTDVTQNYSVNYDTDHTIPTEIDEELSYLIGLLVSSGSYDSKEYRIDYTHQKTELLDVYQTILLKKFGVSCNRYVNKQNETTTLNFYSKTIRLFLLRCGLTYSTYKSVPVCILENNYKCQKQFIRGLFDMDNVTLNVEFSTTSKTLSTEIHIILFNIGFISSKTYSENTKCWMISLKGDNAKKYIQEIMLLSYDQPVGNCSQAIGKIPNGNELIVSLIDDIRQKYDCYIIDELSNLIDRIINGISELQVEHLHLIVNNMPHIYEYEAGRTLIRYYELNYFFDEVVTIETSECQMYDFNVPVTHSFISNGIISHNCQGSSYEECFIDDTEFDMIKDRWNIRYNRLEKRIREKNQLRYVAYTRPKRCAYVLTKP